MDKKRPKIQYIIFESTNASFSIIIVSKKFSLSKILVTGLPLMVGDMEDIPLPSDGSNFSRALENLDRQESAETFYPFNFDF